MTDDISIDLSGYSDRFAEPCRMDGVSRVNFIYGKNGTGKSTICEAIGKEFTDDYDVRIFQGFEKLLGDNQTLDAFALGEENVEIQRQVADLDERIHSLSRQIDTKSEDENLGKRLATARDDEKNVADSVDKIRVTEAKRIKDITPRVARPAYNKNDFINDASHAKQLDPQERKQAQDILRQDGDLPLPKTVAFPQMDLPRHREIVNELMKRSISQSAVIKEIGDNSEKRRFAFQGMKIHSRTDGEKCAFCGGVLTPGRWEILDRYFSDAEQKLKNDLDAEHGIVENFQKQIAMVGHLSKEGFYPPYIRRVDTLNDLIDSTKDNVMRILSVLLDALDNRANAILRTRPEIYFDGNPNFLDIRSGYDELRRENTEFGSNLEQKQQEARERLRLHEVWNSLSQNDYVRLNQQARDASRSRKLIQAEVCSKREDIKTLKEKRIELFKKTRSETLAAEKINTYLKSLGTSSFTLVLEPASGYGTGNYSIQGNDGKKRPITALSTGEKNIIAFLYFMEKIRVGENAERPKLIVLDDPMNSNDDTAQFLMMGAVKQYYDPSLKESSGKMSDDDILIILTHNAYFYLNVKPYKGGYNKTQRYFHLRKNAGHTIIQRIYDKEHDIQTSYASLWNDLHFAYARNHPGFMWNSMRRIITTFAEFNGIPLNELLEKTDSATDNTLGSSLHKALNVNSHELLDFEFDSNTCDNQQLINFLHEVFTKIGYEEHFIRYWPDFKKA